MGSASTGGGRVAALPCPASPARGKAESNCAKPPAAGPPVPASAAGALPSAARIDVTPPCAAARGRLAITTGLHRSGAARSEEHTSELQSLMRISYAVFCLKKKQNRHNIR